MQNSKDISGLTNPDKNPSNDPKFLKELFKDITRDVDEIKDKSNETRKRQEIIIKENIELKEKLKIMEAMILSNENRFKSYSTNKETLERFKEVDKKIAKIIDNLDSIKEISLASASNGGGGNNLEIQKQLMAMQNTEQSGRYVSLQSFQDFKSLYYSQTNKMMNEIEEKYIKKELFEDQVKSNTKRIARNEKYIKDLKDNHDTKLSEILNQLDKLFFKDDFYDHER